VPIQSGIPVFRNHVRKPGAAARMRSSWRPGCRSPVTAAKCEIALISPTGGGTFVAIGSSGVYAVPKPPVDILDCGDRRSITVRRWGILSTATAKQSSLHHSPASSSPSSGSPPAPADQCVELRRRVRARGKPRRCAAAVNDRVVVHADTYDAHSSFGQAAFESAVNAAVARCTATLASAPWRHRTPRRQRKSH